MTVENQQISNVRDIYGRMGG